MKAQLTAYLSLTSRMNTGFCAFETFTRWVTARRGCWHVWSGVRLGRFALQA
ncbi:MAG: hypothetical protein Q8N89_04460 [Azonexus sp.]|nr:hypothetical protein [Azonexus sp.]